MAEKKILKLFVLAFFVTVVTGNRKVGYTVTGQRCMSNCEPYSGRHFCYMGWGSSNWEYCTISDETVKVERTTSLVKNPKNSFCVSDCRATATSNHWCFTTTDWNNWDFCSPEDGYTYVNSKCDDRCLFDFSLNYFACTSSGSREYCSPGAKQYVKYGGGMLPQINGVHQE